MPNHVHLIVWLLSPDDVGASVKDAPDEVAQDTIVPERAGARPAATTPDGVVRATLAVARNAVDPDTEWAIPQSEAGNLHPTLGDVLGAFKALAFTVYLDWIDRHDPVRHAKFWQRNYHEHLIRQDTELAAIRRYIHLDFNFFVGFKGSQIKAMSVKRKPGFGPPAAKTERTSWGKGDHRRCGLMGARN